MTEELTALLRFHLHVGARLAMRALVPVLVAAVAGITLLGMDFINSFSALLWGPRSKGGSGVLIAALCYGVAASAAPRVCRGLDGWLRHLPIGGGAQRRAAALAIAVAQTPLLIGLAILSLPATKFGRATFVDVLCLLVCAAAAALAAMPVERPLLTRPLALGAAVVVVSGSWLLLGGGIVLLAAADLCAGELPREKRPSLAGRGNRRAIGRWTGSLVELRIAWRALRWRASSALWPPACCRSPARLRVRGPQRAGAGARAARGAARRRLLASSSCCADRRGARRPPAGVALVALAPLVRARGASCSDALLPGRARPAARSSWRRGSIPPRCPAPCIASPSWLAVRAAGAMRRAPERRTGAAGRDLLRGRCSSPPLVALLPVDRPPRALAASPGPCGPRRSGSGGRRSAAGWSSTIWRRAIRSPGAPRDPAPSGRLLLPRRRAGARRRRPRDRAPG